MGSISDSGLWRRSQRGDKDAFAELFDRYARRVYGFCFRGTGDWALAQDLTSVTFLEAWRRRSTSVDEGYVLAWLLGVANNVVRNERRSLRRHRAALARLPAPSAEPDHAEEVAARAAAEERGRELLARMQELSAVERDVVALVAWEGLTSLEAAAALGVPESTVRTRLHRARQRLREHEHNEEDHRLVDEPIAVDERRAW